MKCITLNSILTYHCIPVPKNVGLLSMGVKKRRALLRAFLCRTFRPDLRKGGNMQKILVISGVCKGLLLSC